MKRYLLRIALLFIITGLSGCVPAKYIEGQNKVDRMLAEPIKVTKLPMSVKVTIDDQSKNMVVSSRAENAPVRMATLPIGQQMVASVNQVADMLFEHNTGKADFDADLFIEIRRFDFRWRVVTDLPTT